MTDLQKQIYAVLLQNKDNRLTTEMINGIAARIGTLISDNQQTEKENAISSEVKNG